VLQDEATSVSPVGRAGTPAAACKSEKANVGKASLSRKHFLQSALDAVEFLADDANRLLVARRVRVRREGLERCSDLVVAVPDQVEFRDGAAAVLEHVPHERRGKPGEHEAEEGLDREPIFGTIIVGEQ